MKKKRDHVTLNLETRTCGKDPELDKQDCIGVFPNDEKPILHATSYQEGLFFGWGRGALRNSFGGVSTTPVHGGSAIMQLWQ